MIETTDQGETSSQTPKVVASGLSAGMLMIALLAVDVAVFMLQKMASSGDTDEGWRFFVTLLRSPTVWLMVCLLPVQLWLWTRILASSDIGWAYPVTSLAYPLTMVMAALVFSERYDWHVWVGALLITAGAAVLGSPQRSDTLGSSSGSSQLPR